MTIRQHIMWAGPIALLSSFVGPADAQRTDQTLQADSYQAGDFNLEPSDPVIATVEGRDLHLSAIGAAMRYLPEAARDAPFRLLYPVLLEILVEHEALLIEAYSQRLDDDPTVAEQLRAAADDVARGDILGQALIERKASEQVTEAAIRTRYQATYGDKAGEDQVRVKLIVLGSGPEAQAVIHSLNNGADFATMAARSIEPETARNADLGLLRRDRMRPEIADVAFTLQPGQIAPMPVMTDIGFNVVKLEERRFVPTPSLDEARYTIRQELISEMVDQVVKDARAAVRIRKVNMDRSPLAP